MKKSSFHKRVTRKDVARLAGTSLAAVSFVLNNTPGARISHETRQRILVAAQQLGYRASAAARAIITGKTQTIGILLCNTSELFDPYTTLLLQQIWPTIHQKRYRMLFDVLQDDRDIASFYRDHSADGAIIIAPPDRLEGITTLVEAQYPTVSIGSEICNKIDYVDLDNLHAGLLATQTLIQHGHRQIAHITGNMNMTCAQERYWGYRQALEEAHIPFSPELVVEGLFGNRHETYMAIETLLNRSIPFTAIFAASDEIAQKAIQVVCQHHLRVPEDISVIGINGFRSPELVRVEDKVKVLTTIRQPIQQIANTAIHLLFQYIEDPSLLNSMGKKILLRGELVYGETIKEMNLN